MNFLLIPFAVTVSRQMVKKEIIRKTDIIEKAGNFYKLLNEQERKEFLKEITVRQYKHDELIYQEGEVPTHLLCLISGKAKVFKEGIARRQQIIRLVNAVDFFGFRDHFAN